MRAILVSFAAAVVAIKLATGLPWLSSMAIANVALSTLAVAAAISLELKPRNTR